MIVGFSLFALGARQSHAASSSQIKGVGLTVEEWLAANGDPDKYTKPTGLLGSHASAIYSRSDHSIDIWTPFNDPDNLIHTLFVYPSKNLSLASLEELARLYLPSDSRNVRTGDGPSTTYLDYSSQALSKKFEYESDQALDGTIRAGYRKAKRGDLYESIIIYLGTYTFV